MLMRRNYFLYLCLTTFLYGCAAPSVSVNYSSNIDFNNVKKIALMPSGGPLADAIGIQLLSYGVDVIDTSTTTSILARLNLNEFEIKNPQNIKLLSARGIDTILIVKTVAGYDGRPNSAIARLVDTATGSLLVGSTWQNGKAGAMGSPADGMMRANINTAADALATSIGSIFEENTSKSMRY